MARLNKVKTGIDLLAAKKKLGRRITFMNFIKILEVITLVYIAYKLSGR